MTVRSALAFSLLGIPVSLEVACERVRARLALCYEAAEPSSSGVDKVVGSVTKHGEGFTVEVSGREVHRGLTETDAVRALNHELLHAVMRRAPENFYIHGAVVAFPMGGVLLPGLSQSGKSTVGLALTERGGRFLSDELLVFDAGTGELRAFPRAFKIRDACVPYFPRLKEHFVGEGEGRFLRAEALAFGVAATCRPAVIVLPKWTPGEDTLDPVPSGEALLALAASALNFGTHKERSVDLLLALTAGVPAYKLAWSDPHRAASRILCVLGLGP